MSMGIIRCRRCKRTPEEIPEYIGCAAENDCTPDEYVEREEGTFNRATGEFWCTECYIARGMPLGTA